MADLEKICTQEADRERLLEALKELRDQGVILIDDQAGRPQVVAAQGRVNVKKSAEKTTDRLLLDNLESLYEIEEPGIDPYNRRPK